jgi:uncharacterized protein involved in exopolysaccharide biosynthesis
MRPYLETFFRHPRALVAPIVLVLVISLGMVAAQPRTYQASARVWFQSNTIAGVSNPTTAIMTPAEAAAGVFQELLATRSFVVAVGHRGPLATYMSQGHLPAADPLSAALGLVQQLRGKAPGDQQQILDDAVQGVLQKQVTVAPSGPEIVGLTFTYTSPEVASATLQALLNQFADEVLAAQRSQANQQMAFYAQQVASQQQVSKQADQEVQQYLAAHPNLSVPNPPFDANLASLQQVSTQAQQQYAQLLQKLSEAKLQQQNLNQGDPSQFRVIDKPVIPHKADSLLKGLLTGVGAGLAIGLLVSLLALVVLVFTDRTMRSPIDVERALRVKVVGTVPFQAATNGHRMQMPPAGSAERSPRIGPGS